jgi:hypothetical protein
MRMRIRRPEKGANDDLNWPLVRVVHWDEIEHSEQQPKQRKHFAFHNQKLNGFVF